MSNIMDSVKLQLILLQISEKCHQSQMVAIYMNQMVSDIPGAVELQGAVSPSIHEFVNLHYNHY